MQAQFSQVRRADRHTRNAMLDEVARWNADYASPEPGETDTTEYYLWKNAHAYGLGQRVNGQDQGLAAEFIRCGNPDCQAIQLMDGSSEDGCRECQATWSSQSNPPGKKPARRQVARPEPTIEETQEELAQVIMQEEIETHPRRFLVSRDKGLYRPEGFPTLELAMRRAAELLTPESPVNVSRMDWIDAEGNCSWADIRRLTDKGGPVEIRPDSRPSPRAAEYRAARPALDPLLLEAILHCAVLDHPGASPTVEYVRPGQTHMGETGWTLVNLNLNLTGFRCALYAVAPDERIELWAD